MSLGSALAQKGDCKQGVKDTQGVVVLCEAQAVFQPDGQATISRAVTLSHRWDETFPTVGGTATYRLSLPAPQSAKRMALLFRRLGNQAVVSVNGEIVMVLGELGNPRYDAAKSVQLVDIPANLLRSDGPTELLVQVTAQASRWGGLSSVQYGPATELQTEFATLRSWRNGAALIFCAAFAMMATMAMALWARLRDPLFACFAAASFLGIFRNLDRFMPEVPLPWPLWGIVTATAYAWHLALMCFFALMALNRQQHAIGRAVLVYLPLSLALVVVAFATPMPIAWTAALALLTPLGLITWAIVLRIAWQKDHEHRTTAVVLGIVGGAAILAGLHDLGWVRLGVGGGPSRFSLTPHTMFFFVVIMAGIIVDRYANSVRRLRSLNQTLETRIRAKEEALSQAFDTLQAERSAQIRATERQRILRDLHDGVGAQLVGLLNMVKQPGAKPELLEEQVKAALDEMRLAVDSMQIGDGDLTTALATLRYRVQPRLQAAGLTLHWDVQELPVLPDLSPTAVLQVQRIMLEALTNVLKHAHASAVWVHCAPHVQNANPPPGAQGITLAIADDGLGLPTGIGSGHGEGMASMQARAVAIGGALHITPRPGGGTLVQLRWPA